MDKYSVTRELADSWGLLGMMIFYIGAILILFRPGNKKMHADASNIPFRNDDDMKASASDKNTDRQEGLK